MRQRCVFGMECTCGEKFNGWCNIESGQLRPAPCPKCGKPVAPHSGEEAAERKTYGNRRFSGEEGVSVKHGFHPNEVKLARKLMPKSAECIRSDGSVEYPDSRAARTFAKELNRAQNRLGIPHRPW